MDPIDEIDRIIAKEAGWVVDGADCPPNCEYCRADLEDARPKLGKLYAALKSAGYVIVPSTSGFMDRDKTTSPPLEYGKSVKLT